MHILRELPALRRRRARSDTSSESSDSSSPPYPPTGSYFPPTHPPHKRHRPFPPFPTFTHNSPYAHLPPSHPRTPPSPRPPPSLHRETRHVHFAPEVTERRQRVTTVQETVYAYITPVDMGPRQGGAVESMYYLGGNGGRERPLFLRREPEKSRLRRKRGDREERRERERREELEERRLPEGRRLKRVKGFFWG